MMLSDKNIYTEMQRNFYDVSADIMSETNHLGHNSNPDYYNLLLKEVTNNPNEWQNKNALEFGCGCGRNIKNLLDLAPFTTVDGCDISKENIIRSETFMDQSMIHKNKYNLYVTNGVDLNPISSNKYDFVFSTIVLQHICVYDIRLNILKDIYRVLNENGLFSFQMAKYDRAKVSCAHYYDNKYDVKGTNGFYDVNIDDPQNMIDDLKNIGYKNISFEIKPEWDAWQEKYVTNNNNWIFFKAYK